MITHSGECGHACRGLLPQHHDGRTVLLGEAMIHPKRVRRPQRWLILTCPLTRCRHGPGSQRELWRLMEQPVGRVDLHW